MTLVERLRGVAGMDLRTGGFLAHTMDTAKEAADEIARLRAEIERLRAALQKIIAEADSDDGLTAWDGANIARAALAGEQSRTRSDDEAAGYVAHTHPITQQAGEKPKDFVLRVVRAFEWCKNRADEQKAPEK